MLVEKRKQIIISINNELQGVSIKELAVRLSVSNMTILRDIQDLEEANLVKKVRGGIIPVDGVSTVQSKLSRAYESKLQESASDKKDIAEYCANNLVSDGNVIILEGGSTANYMIPFLKEKKKLTIMTNGLLTLYEAYNSGSQAKLIASGGLLQEPYLIFMGHDTESFFSGKNADISFISCVGFDLDIGAMDSNQLDVQSKRAMVKGSQRRVLMVDKKKFNVRSLMQTVLMSEITDIVTNKSVSDDILKKLNGFKAKLHLV